MSECLLDDPLDPISRVWRDDAVYPSLAFCEKRHGSGREKTGTPGEKKKRCVVVKKRRGDD